MLLEPHVRLNFVNNGKDRTSDKRSLYHVLVLDVIVARLSIP